MGSDCTLTLVSVLLDFGNVEIRDKAIQKSVKAICSFTDSFVLSHTHPLVSHTKQIYSFYCEGEVIPFDLRSIPKQLRSIGTSIAAAEMHCAAEHALLIVGEITTRG